MTSKLTAADLAYIRRTLEDDLMPDSCYLLTVTETRGSDGGVLSTWGTAAIATTCRVDPLVGKEQNAAGGVSAFHGYVMTVPHDTTVTTKQRVYWNSNTFNILSIDSDKSWAGSLRLKLEKV